MDLDGGDEGGQDGGRRGIIVQKDAWAARAQEVVDKGVRGEPYGVAEGEEFEGARWRVGDL